MTLAINKSAKANCEAIALPECYQNTGSAVAT